MAGNYRFGSVGDLVTWLNRYYYLGSTLGHPVEDGTGLKGNFDIQLKLGAGTMPAEDPLLALVKKQLGLDPVVTQGHAKYVAIDDIQHFRKKWTWP